MFTWILTATVGAEANDQTRTKRPSANLGLPFEVLRGVKTVVPSIVKVDELGGVQLVVTVTELELTLLAKPDTLRNVRFP